MDLDNTRGIALAGQSVAFSLVGKLRPKGVITHDEAVEIFEQALTVIEAYPEIDPGMQSARQILDHMAQIAASWPR